mmetsp:Transcript_3330/g.8563  ORF Transcript_3330/g.8563 Transcript_3330/m.8563 type:complete len:473 (-) Transcript_3330:1400-2818(-)
MVVAGIAHALVDPPLAARLVVDTVAVHEVAVFQINWTINRRITEFRPGNVFVDIRGEGHHVDLRGDAARRAAAVHLEGGHPSSRFRGVHVIPPHVENILGGSGAGDFGHFPVNIGEAAEALVVHRDVGVDARVLGHAAGKIPNPVSRLRGGVVPRVYANREPHLVPAVLLAVVALVDAALDAAVVLEVCVAALLVPLAHGLCGVCTLVVLAHKVAEAEEVVVHARLLGAAGVPGALVEAAHDIALDMVVGVAAVLRGAARREALVDGALHAVIIHLGRDLDLVAVAVARHVTQEGPVVIRVIVIVGIETTIGMIIIIIIVLGRRGAVARLESLFGMLESVGVGALLLGEAHVGIVTVILLAYHAWAVHLEPVNVLAAPVAADAGVQAALVEAAHLAEAAPREHPIILHSRLARLARVANQVVVVAPDRWVVDREAHLEVPLGHAVKVIIANGANRLRLGSKLVPDLFTLVKD